MAGKMWHRILTASMATIFTLSFLVLNIIASFPVYAADELTADFSASPTSGSAPLTVHFNYIATLGGIECSWNFGDGQLGNGYGTEHTYEKPGDYTVTLGIRNGSGAVGHVSKQITVYAAGLVSPAAPNATLATPVNGTASVVPAVIETPVPPTATPVAVTAQPTAKSSGVLTIRGITISEDAMQLIIAGTIAVVIAAFIIIFFSSLGKRQGENKPEKPAVKPRPPAPPKAAPKAAPKAPPKAPKVKEPAPKRGKRSEDISQDYIYGLVTGKNEYPKK